MSGSTTRIAPMLAVRGGARAIEFYETAFGAIERWRIDAGGSVVAGLTIGDAELFLADEAPDYGTRSPAAVGATTVRIELFVENQDAVFARAMAAGATEQSPVADHRYETVGPGPVLRIRQGHVVDPFGHHWLIGRFEPWANPA